MRRFRVRGLLLGLIVVILMAIGLVGAYSYGGAYYQHRGFVSIAQLPRAGKGRLLNVNFPSGALHREAYYLAYLPPGYNPAHHYPVLYLLHGMPGRPRVFIDIANMDVRLDNLLSENHVPPMILVFPDGRIGGSAYSDSEWANTPSGDYENYVLEVVRDVDQRFSTLARRQDRVIGGFSAGGYGAINIALHHLSEFASVEVWSGYFTEKRSGVFAHANKARLTDNSPIDFVGKLKQQLAVDRLRVFMFVGRDDTASAEIAPMDKALKADGASASYAIYPGGHDWQVWYPRLNQMLILASGDVSKPLPPERISGLGRAAAMVALGHRPGIHARRRHRLRRHRLRHHHVRRRPLVRGHSVSGHRRRAVLAHHRRRARRRQRVARGHRRLVGALLLAVASAATINLGFLFQHRGLASRSPGGRSALATVLRSRSWLTGQALGWIGFGTQIVAVALAPLSLVQAFAAGGLAISVPLAAGIFGYRVSRVQLGAVLLIAASLASLPIALSASPGRLHSGALICSALVALLAAVALGFIGRAPGRAIAAGMLYGVADAAIKADSIGWRIHGGAALLSGWSVLAITATLGGFAAFQTALRNDSAVTAISLMNALAALAALTFGEFAFGESLGSTSTATLVHLIAISVVLVCVPVLAGAQQQVTHVDRSGGWAAALAKPVRAGYRAGQSAAGGE